VAPVVEEAVNERVLLLLPQLRLLIVLPHVIFLLFASRGFLLFCPIRWLRSTLFMNPRMKTGLVALPPEALV
jgi:hypothetical protein